MKEQFANIIVDISVDKLDRTFQYRIPDELAGAVCEGSRVRIPFGKGNVIKEGYVFSIEDEPRLEREKIKDVLEYVPGSVTVEGKLFTLAAWMRNQYGSTMNQALKTVLPVKQLRKRKPKEKEMDRILPEIEPIPELNELQKKVLEGICHEQENKNRPCLIQGITGSGKTYIYIHLIEKTIQQGRQAILLIPEISLTWQTLNRFYKCFGERVGVLNSKMSKGERADLVEKVKAGEIDLVIGPRSALFTPFPDLGLILIDEEHETSYQSEVTPRYHARETAIKRAEIENAYVVFGSATPSVEAIYACRNGQFAHFMLTERFGSANLPSVSVVDMREELREGNRSILSMALKEAIQDRLDKKEQIMLFLNRRGHTGFISCRSCGTVVKCPHCDVSLTMHKGGKLVCHYCGYTEPMIRFCKECGSPFIGGFSVGTEQVEELVASEFPGARILRMDADTTKRKGSFEKILDSFSRQKADILIGTQMIVKGHDFPNVTLVGILAADMSLHASDYRAGERTFQLISQAIGRAGRGSKKGEAVIQTYDPDHFAIISAVDGNFDMFYNEELEDREMLEYPPSGHMIAVHGSGEEEEHLYRGMEHLKRYALTQIQDKEIRILGPAEENISKVADVYRAALYLKGKNTADLIRLRRKLEKYIEINKGFDPLNIQFNLDN